MAHDLDEQEFLATRKLFGLDKKENKQQNYDDNDYLINREECVEYNNDNNINISSIEEAIKIVKSLIENTKESLISNTKLSQNRKTNRIIAYKATEYLLSEYTRQKQINEELMNEYHKRVQEKIDLKQELEEAIPIQKIKDKIEELKNEKNRRTELGIFILKDYENQHLIGEISSLEELLEESEDN